MGKRIVIALGGNALGNNLPEQMKAVKITAKIKIKATQPRYRYSRFVNPERLARSLTLLLDRSR